MPEAKSVHVDLAPNPLPQDLTPLHERLQAVEAQVPDLRERLARAETSIKDAALHNPASEEALRLASEARQLAASALKKITAREDVPPVPKVVELVEPPEPIQDLPDPLDQPQPEIPEPPKPFWHRWV